MPEVKLPDRFRDLEPIAEGWALRTEAERHARRLASTIEELRAVYDALIPRIDDMLAYLSEFPLESLGPQGDRLLHLAFALAEVGPAVELYGQPEVPNGYDSRRFIPADGQ
jgi:hypothetical protein